MKLYDNLRMTRLTLAAEVSQWHEKQRTNIRNHLFAAHCKLKTKCRINRGLFESVRLRFIRFESNDECVEGTVFRAARLTVAIAQLFIVSLRNDGDCGTWHWSCPLPICCNFCFGFRFQIARQERVLRFARSNGLALRIDHFSTENSERKRERKRMNENK